MLPERLNPLNKKQKAHFLNIQLGGLDQTEFELIGHSINLFSCHAASSDLEKDQITNRQGQELRFFPCVHSVACLTLGMLHIAEALQ